MRQRAWPQIRFSDNQLFLALSIVVGILAGLAAVLFTLAIEGVDHFFFGADPSRIRLFLVPPLVSVVTGVLLVRFFPDVRGSGIPQTKVAFHLQAGVIRPRVPIGKFITGVLCVGSGHSMGREGPSVQIGAGIASWIGQWLRLSPARLKELGPVGAAGALAAAFNTPVTAVIFALEEIIGDLNATLLGSTVVASVASVVVARSILGNEPLFRVPDYQLVHPAELAGYALLGLVGGLVSLAFCKLLLRLRAHFLRLPAATRVMQPALGGVAIGAILLVVPQVRGVGYEYIDQALNGGLVLQTLMLLCAVKLLATTASYASGNAGGIFAPSLFIGAMAGGAVGTVVNWVAPFPTGDPGAYALVGMGTLFAGIIRAPLTSVFMIFEITQDYQIFVPLMVANLLSYAISRHYQPESIYDALLGQDGIHLPAPDARLAKGGHTAQAIMDADPRFIDPAHTIEVAWRSAQSTRAQAWLVGSRSQLEGVVTFAGLQESVERGRGQDVVATITAPAASHAHPDHRLDVIIDRLAQAQGVLPVTSRLDARRVEGAITLDDIARFVSPGRDETPAGE